MDRTTAVAEIGYCEDCGRGQYLPSAESGLYWIGWCLICVDNHSRAEKIGRIQARRPR